MTPATPYSPRSDWKPPRYRRLGGYVMTHKTAEQWAARLLGEQLEPEFLNCATQFINRRIKQHGLRIRTVGEERCTPPCMIVTQAAWFRGYMDMPALDIPQFVEGEREKRVKAFLQEQGVEDFEFQTYLD
ncbi:hypothetical protein LshimejAT787_1204950 [Lyophyllum shimeji]|uniref:Uncharacterized protein n=1 Tax=Lyophyllum shimeji TaxID=47721 RepID=A0A9P3UUC8_LYOSH|nr:hypothetical protein LshimejAT787_1204950 [Lyophyllum shimeji]